MNFSSNSSSRHSHFLRAGLQGTKFSNQNNNNNVPLIIKPEYISLTSSSNHSGNDNHSNLENSGNNKFTGPTFLTISKSRVPDIQMINKYYGLVPKKFVINARSDFSSKSSTRLQRPRTAAVITTARHHSLDDYEAETTESLLDENLVTKSNRLKDQQQCEVAGNNNNSVNGGKLRRSSSSSSGSKDDDGVDVSGLVTRKMPVEKHKKLRRIKNCGRTLSMMDNCESMGSMAVGCKHGGGQQTGSSMADRMEIQRVIKIDLNHMRWEESYQERWKADKSVEGSANGDEDVNENDSGRLPTNSPSLSPVKRGALRKTISFDEQIMRNNLPAAAGENSSAKRSPAAAEKIEQKPSSRRPTTATPSTGLSATQPLTPTAPPSTPKVVPWTSRTGQSLAERRAKFQKSFSIYQDSLDNGESDNEAEPGGDGNYNSTISSLSSSSSSASVKCQHRDRESKKSLHVQAPPEISTMISLISPTPPAPDEQDDLQAEIDKVDTVITSCHNKIAEVEKLSLEEALPPPPAPPEQPQEEPTQPQAKPTDIVPTESITKPTETTSSKVSEQGSNSSSNTKKILKKAASISCENELEPKKAPSTNNGRARPQTSRPKNTVSFSTSNSTRYIPSRRNTFVRSATISSSPFSNNHNRDAAGSASSRTSSPEGHSPGSRNRKILIKKALIEINQSTSINFGKKIRPRTAPMPEKKAHSVAGGQNQKRQPLKASPPTKVPPPLVRKNSNLTSSSMELPKHGGGGKGTATTKDSSPERAPPEPSPPKVRVIPRKSISMTDGFLHGFNYSHNEDGDTDGLDITASMMNSKKREECLKVYEKMMKSGCTVKLETIFRGLMTPSEYRMFVQAKELAEKKALEEEQEAETENINPAGDAGIPVTPTDL